MRCATLGFDRRRGSRREVKLEARTSAGRFIGRNEADARGLVMTLRRLGVRRWVPKQTEIVGPQKRHPAADHEPMEEEQVHCPFVGQMEEEQDEQAGEAGFAKPDEERNRELGDEDAPGHQGDGPGRIENPRRWKAAKVIVEPADIVERCAIEPRLAAELDQSRREEHGSHLDLQQAQTPAGGEAAGRQCGVRNAECGV